MRAAHRQRVATLPRVSGLFEAGARDVGGPRFVRRTRIGMHGIRHREDPL